MKGVLFTFLGLTAIGTSAMAQKISFNEKEYNFGLIQEKNGQISHDFTFQNKGNKPLSIKKIITGCGCTSVLSDKNIYAPGEQGKLKVTYHPKGRNAESFSIPIEIFTNEKFSTTLTITGEVELEEHPYYKAFNPDKGKKAQFIKQSPKDDFELILQRVREQLYHSGLNKKALSHAPQLMLQLTPDGTWDEIDYNCLFRTNWEPLIHLENVRLLAIAYTNPQSELYGNKILYKAIKQALQAWLERKPKSDNWWHNKISGPQAMADILALMEAGTSTLPAKIKEGVVLFMEDCDPRKWTGANKMDIAIHNLVRGCVLKNDSIVDINVKEFFQPVCFTDFEGIMKDMSYQQHGKQVYISGYGKVFVDNIVKNAPLFLDTKFAMEPEKRKLFSDFVRNTYLNVMRSRYCDFSICGRSVSRVNILDSGTYDDLFTNMKMLDPEHKQIYEDAEKRFKTLDSTIGRDNRNTLFYLSDYMLHNRKNYDFSVRAVSKRTCRSESGNGENLFGTFVAEGATNIRVNGDEYLNIFPVWEWDKIPGTTTPSGEVENHFDWGVRGVSDFVGGVSDGQYGVMAYAMNDFQMKANKGWFMFDDEIVCLGAGINSNSGKEIHTSINQCHLKGHIDMTEWKKTTTTDSNATNTHYSQKAVLHDHIGYFLPEDCNLNIKNDIQKGKWSKINFNQPNEEVSLPVFNMWISHGVNPTNQKYAYIIVPNIESVNALKDYKQDFLKIECNERNLQAVSNSKLDMLQAIFFEAGTLNCNDYTIKANKPCVIMIKGISQENPEILVADPTQQQGLKVGTDVTFNKN